MDILTAFLFYDNEDIRYEIHNHNKEVIIQGFTYKLSIERDKFIRIDDEDTSESFVLCFTHIRKIVIKTGVIKFYMV